jgi:LL-diaminopimelate aminotransferase
VSNPLLLKAYALVKDNIDNGQFIAIQKSGCEALDNGASLLASNKEKYRRRLAITASILRDAGIDAKPSAGSFYLYVKVPEQFQGNTFGNAQEFTNFLIAKHGIITVPWDDVTPHIRLSMTFEIGTSDFATEDDVFTELRKRLVG